MRVFIPRFLGALAYLVGLTLVGVVGYTIIEGWGIHDALYMSVITITAVGYSEVLPLSELGRDFTMALLAAGITGVGIWFALITSFIVEFDLSDVRRRHQIMRSIEALNDHIVLCGGGRTGRQVMEELLSLGQEFVVIERDPTRLEWIHEQYPEVLTVLGRDPRRQPDGGRDPQGPWTPHLSERGPGERLRVSLRPPSDGRHSAGAG